MASQDVNAPLPHTSPETKNPPHASAVEDVVGLPERAPVALLPEVVLPRVLLGMTRAGGDECDVLGGPAVVEQPLHLVVRDAQPQIRRLIELVGLDRLPGVVVA